MELVKLDIWDGIWLRNHCLPAQEMPKVISGKLVTAGPGGEGARTQEMLPSGDWCC